MMRTGMALALAAMCLVQPLAAQEPDAGAAAQLTRWQAKEARLFTIGWRLVTGNAPFCRDAAPAIGMLLHDAASYHDPASVRAALKLRADVAVQAVAPASPAAEAGIRANATLWSVNEVLLAEHFPPTDPKWERMVAVNEAVDAEFALTGPAVVAWSSADGTAHVEHIAAVPACPSKFELEGGTSRAIAEGSRVIVGDRFVGFDWEDELLAAAVAHELAHNLLRHRAWLDENGRSRQSVRETEREADRMMPWLLANAGYPPEAAVQFMRRWGPGSLSGALGGIFRARTHDGWDERAELIAAELPAIATAMAAEGRADWRTRFPAASKAH